MKEVKLYVSQSEEIPRSSFLVARVTSQPAPSEKFGPDNIEQIYYGESGRADALFGWGIIRWIVGRGKKKGQAMIIFNPDDEIPPCIEKLQK